MACSSFGALTVRHLFDDEANAVAEVICADPRTCFSDELLNAIKDGASIYPYVRVEGFEEFGPHICRQATCSPDRTCFKGIRLHIDAINQHVIYLIGDYIPAWNAWHAAWPD